MDGSSVLYSIATSHGDMNARRRRLSLLPSLPSAAGDEYETWERYFSSSPLFLSASFIPIHSWLWVRRTPCKREKGENACTPPRLVTCPHQPPDALNYIHKDLFSLDGRAEAEDGAQFIPECPTMDKKAKRLRAKKLTLERF